MSHLHRFYIGQETPPLGETALLTGPEAHHALHVARLRAGDDVELFDGVGREWDAQVLETSRHDVCVAMRGAREVPRPAGMLTLFQAWLHREKAVEELVRHGTEIGISRFVFYPSHHSERAPRVRDKWRRTAIEACKQCRRAWLPAFETVDSLEEALGQAGGTLLVATCELPCVPISTAITSEDVSLFVGPEGDFTEQELGAFVAREAKALSLGEVTYRSEVAAVLASAIILHRFGQLGPL